MTDHPIAHAERELADFYRETVLRHSVEPVGFQADILATHENEQYNPLCGDRVLLRFQVAGDKIEAAAFDGAACAICMASASLLCEDAAGKKVSHVHATHDWLQKALKGKEETQGPQSLQALLGVRRYPSRIKCAMLPWIAAVKALGG
jgi:nitrogen fixation NifU-like protein